MSKDRSYIDETGEVTELDAAFFAKAKRGRPPLPDSARKKRITIMLDPDVLERFQRDGKGWQSRINAALREHVGI